MKIVVNEDAFSTNRNFRILKIFVKPIIKLKYKPIVIRHEENSELPVLYAPNHRQTLDPFIISIFANNPIHWVALKRFFTGEDSIFNNSKKPILCKATILLFKGIGAIPVLRTRDIDENNPEQIKEYQKQNKETFCLITSHLKAKNCVGIFPEETTNKNCEEVELLELKKGFVRFAKKNKAFIQPVAIVWTPKHLHIKNRVVINFLPKIEAANISEEEALLKWNDSVYAGIMENNVLIKKLGETK